MVLNRNKPHHITLEKEYVLYLGSTEEFKKMLGGSAVNNGCEKVKELVIIGASAAYSIGLGSCWIHRTKQMFESEEGKALLKEWGIAGDYVGVGSCILGYPDCENPKASPRKDNFIVMVK